MWITNDPEMAKKLKAIDVAYHKKRETASHLPLARKLMAYKEADEERRDAMESFARSFPEGGWDDPTDCPACSGLGADPVTGADCGPCHGGGTVTGGELIVRERDIMHEAGPYWVGRTAQGYAVFRNGVTHATSESAYALNPDGLSIAIARCDYLADRLKGARTVTVADAERVIWTGPYRDFERENLKALSVTEWCALERTGSLTVGGGAAPELQITLARTPESDAHGRAQVPQSVAPVVR